MRYYGQNQQKSRRACPECPHLILKKHRSRHPLGKISCNISRRDPLSATQSHPRKRRLGELAIRRHRLCNSGRKTHRFKPGPRAYGMACPSRALHRQKPAGVGNPRLAPPRARSRQFRGGLLSAHHALGYPATPRIPPIAQHPRLHHPCNLPRYIRLGAAIPRHRHLQRRSLLPPGQTRRVGVMHAHLALATQSPQRRPLPRGTLAIQNRPLSPTPARLSPSHLRADASPVRTGIDISHRRQLQRRRWTRRPRRPGHPH